MAFTYGGTVTAFYGKQDFAPDGSYITTEFFSVFWIPVIPIRSLRVKLIDHDWGIPPFTERTYVVLWRGGPNVRQVGNVYGFVALLVGFTGFYVNIADYFPRVPLEKLVLGEAIGVAAISSLPFLLRWRARRHGASV